MQKILTILVVICSLVCSNIPISADGQTAQPGHKPIERYGPFEEPKVKALAECIMILQPKVTPFMASFIALHVNKESKEKGLDPDLVLAQIWVESEFNPNATSNKAARGLMQIRYEVWKNTPQLKDNGVNAQHKIYWIDANIQCGTDILASFLKEANGNIAIALNRYWCGSPKLEKKPWENEYINKIMYYFYKIREHQLSGTPLEREEEFQPTAAAPAPAQLQVQKSGVVTEKTGKSEPPTKKP